MHVSFTKLIQYLAVSSKYDTRQLDKLIEMYLNNLTVSVDVVSAIINKFRSNPPAKTQKSLLSNKYTEKTFLKWLEQTNFHRIHDMTTDGKFMDLIFDSDVRFQIDMLAIAKFREKEIIDSIGIVDPAILKVYLEFFCDFSGYTERDYLRHVRFYCEDVIQGEYCRMILENSAKKDFVRSLLKLDMKHIDTVTQIEFMKNVCYFDFEEAVATGDDKKKENSLNRFARMIGTARDVIAQKKTGENLQDMLSKSLDDIDEPKIYSVEELNALSQQTAK